MNKNVNKILSEREKISLDELFIELCGIDIYRKYSQSKNFHFYLLKYLKKSDAFTLKYLRKVLYDSGILSLNKEKTWRIDRTLGESKEILGCDTFKLKKR